MSFTSASLLAAWVMIALLALAMSGLYARIRELEPGSPGFSDQLVGSYAPVMGDGRGLTDTIVLFLSQSCGVCESLLAEVASAGRSGALPTANVIAVFAAQDAGELPSWATADGLKTYADPVFVRRFGITATPTVGHIDAEGRITHLAPVASAERFSQLVLKLSRGNAANPPAESVTGEGS